MTMRFLTGLNWFGAGVFFALLGVQLEPNLAASNPPWWCAVLATMFTVLAFFTALRRAS